MQNSKIQKKHIKGTIELKQNKQLSLSLSLSEMIAQLEMTQQTVTNLPGQFLKIQTQTVFRQPTKRCNVLAHFKKKNSYVVVFNSYQT